MTIIDFHTHVFPDSIAERAIAQLSAAANEHPVLDGKLASLVNSMDAAGVSASVIASIATKPTQFQPILDWSKGIASERIYPFASIHPQDTEAIKHISMVRAHGLKGIKMHPYYQEFALDEARMFPLYDALAQCGLILLCHTGFDIAYPRNRICDPEKIARVVKEFPELIFIASHLGAWEDWDEVEKYLLGKPVYLELSFSIQFLGKERARRMLLAHPEEYLLFGTDSPWADQKECIDMVKDLKLGTKREALLLGGNAERLLGMQSEKSR